MPTLYVPRSWRFAIHMFFHWAAYIPWWWPPVLRICFLDKSLRQTLMMGLGRIGVQELKEISQQARRHIVPRRPGSILYFATHKSKITVRNNAHHLTLSHIGNRVNWYTQSTPPLLSSSQRGVFDIFFCLQLPKTGLEIVLLLKTKNLWGQYFYES